MARILLVEDNELNRDMLSRRLRRRGYELSIAVDGAEAIAIASVETFDLILMDMSLPVMDGWEATRRLKAQPHTQHIPIIALTAHAMRGDRDQALAAGCDDYDTKPVDLKRLLGKIKSFLSAEQLANASDTPQPIRTPKSSPAAVVPIKLETPPVIHPEGPAPGPSLPEPLPAVAAWLPEEKQPLDAQPVVLDDSWGSNEEFSLESVNEEFSLESANEEFNLETSNPSGVWGPPVQSSIIADDPMPPITSASLAELDELAAMSDPETAADRVQTAPPVATEKPKNAFSGLPILVVDDNDDNCDMLSRRLTRRGYQAVVVNSGEAALDYIANHANVGLVLLDIMMPGIDGIETLRRLRRTYTRNQLPVLMVTAKAQSDDMVKAFELGANDYITKPIDFAVTLARIETQLAIVKATKMTSPPPVVENRVVAPSTPNLHSVPKEGTASESATTISLVPKNSFSRFAADRYQVQYFLRQEPLGPISIASDRNTDALVLLQTLKTYSKDTTDILKRVMEKETEVFQTLRSLFPGYTYGQVDDTFYIVHSLGSDFQQDQLLQAQLQRPWPLDSVLALMDCLLEQISVFHRHNQIHAGLRDDCFVQTKAGEPLGQSLMLIDSGLGKRVMIGVSQKSAEYRKQLLMQRDYQPLEQRIARPAMSSDVYALGLIGLQALTGKSVDLLTMPSVSGEFQWREYTSIPDPIAEWFDRLVHQSQKKRFEHAMAARNALAPHLKSYLAEPG